MTPAVFAIFAPPPIRSQYNAKSDKTIAIRQWRTFYITEDQNSNWWLHWAEHINSSLLIKWNFTYTFHRNCRSIFLPHQSLKSSKGKHVDWFYFIFWCKSYQVLVGLSWDFLKEEVEPELECWQLKLVLEETSINTLFLYFLICGYCFLDFFLLLLFKMSICFSVPIKSM